MRVEGPLNRPSSRETTAVKISRLFGFFVLPALLLIGSCSSTPVDRSTPAGSLPTNPMERAAIESLYTSYKESTMWQIKDPKVLGITQVLPMPVTLEDYDPKEIYCICVEYLARYKVAWTTTDPSPWERTVRNLAVMKTQGDNFMAIKTTSICTPFCQ